MSGAFEAFESERLVALEAERAELEQKLGEGAASGDRAQFAELGRRLARIGEIIDVAHEARDAQADAEAAQDLLDASDGDDAAEASDMLEVATERAASLDERLKDLLLPQDPNDERDVIVEIQGAEGGEEANIWARDLFEMYRAYVAAQPGWSFELLGSQDSDMGGFTNVTFAARGPGVWRTLKHEGGPHRVQRVPVTESQGRVHTSSATVSVLPEAEEVDVEIDPNDLIVDTFRSSGPGGQSVNTTDSAVRVTHKPTGVVVSMQDEKSQLQNRAKAMRVLRSRLLQLQQEAHAAEVAAHKRDQVRGGGRSEKIRTYNFKESRVTDHRVGLTIYKLDRVLAGELDEIVEALASAEREQLLAAAVADGGA
ncbi:peptide chain release factor 1 [Candidatus Poriferisodalis sp.]|uniref:peptide chain release factor 1 n=1 Tax=Candidatus Poriferisodalis sp. TaxID=3101277 RepID=UPI003AF82B54